MAVATSSCDFLESLLAQMPFPTFSLGNEIEVVVQNSGLLELPDDVIERIVGFLPITERVLSVGSVCRRLRTIVKSSIRSLALFNEKMDELSDKHLGYFIRCYGQNIESLNFDLFRSVNQVITQWPWRQSVISIVNLVPNLRELNILVCNRHRLRDADVVQVFHRCPHLESLSMDAHYLIGYCFSQSPKTLKKIELEMCNRISPGCLQLITRTTGLETLHLSQPLGLTDKFTKIVLERLPNLKHLSIVAHPETKFQGKTGPTLTSLGLSELGKHSQLQTLCLEGLCIVNDRFLKEFASKHTPGNLSNLSLAYCNNVGSRGLTAIANISSLQNLNLDGISKSDIGEGLEAIAARKTLVRLLLSGTFITSTSLENVLQTSKSLRLLDITKIVNGGLISAKVFGPRLSTNEQYPKLTILTDEHLTWNSIQQSNKSVEVVHVLRDAVPSHEVQIGSPLSPLEARFLPPGLLCPSLRKGNRYRMLFEAMGPGDTAGTDTSLPILTTKSPTPVESQSVPLPTEIPIPGIPDLLALSNMLSFGQEDPSQAQPMDMEAMMALLNYQIGLLCPNGAGDFTAEQFGFNPEIMGQNDYSQSPLASPPMKPDRPGQLAPAPPVEIPDIPVVNHYRGNRAKRRSRANAATTSGQKSKSPPKQEDPVFVDADFPPLTA